MPKRFYSMWFVAPTLLIFCILFVIPTLFSFVFSTMVWTLKDFRFVGLQNFKIFFSEYSLLIGLKNTLVYGVAVSGAKVVLGLLLGVLLTAPLLKSKNFVRSMVFFPNVISTVAVGITFSAMMHPSIGLFNTGLKAIGISGPDWLGNANLALTSVIGTDVWKNLGVATVIYISGIQAIDANYYEAASIDGASGLQKFFHITLPLVRSSMNSVIILSFVGGLRTFELLWTMTKGGPGFATDTLASIIYKQYAEGFFGLSTAGNVVMFLLIAIIAFPLQRALLNKEVEL